MKSKILNTIIVSIMGLCLVGCYNDYDSPGQEEVYTDESFSSEQLISIKELKDIFYAAYPGETGIGQSLVIEQDYVIRGKSISSDRAGNVYKSLYIYDESSESAIELRLTTGNYINYPPGKMIYVRLQGLVLGNYRSMISVGTYSANPSYANGNIESRVLLSQHILPGETVGLTAADTLVVNSSNYNTLTDDDLGRLVRFEGVVSKFGTARNWSYNNPFPNYFADSNSYNVDSPDETDAQGEVIWSWSDFILTGNGDPSEPTGNEGPTWALKREIPNAEGTLVNTYYYGSAWFTYGTTDQIQGNYVVRSSGYSRFRDQEIPSDGTEVDITAIYTKFSPGGGDYRSAYQLLLNSAADVVVK